MPHDHPADQVPVTPASASLMRHWEFRLEALKAITAEAALRMRKPGDWYVSLSRVHIKGGGLLEGLAGNGRTPEAAVNDAWERATTLPEDRCLKIDIDGVQHVRWNGFMWAPVKPEEK